MGNWLPRSRTEDPDAMVWSPTGPKPTTPVQHPPSRERNNSRGRASRWMGGANDLSPVLGDCSMDTSSDDGMRNNRSYSRRNRSRRDNGEMSQQQQQPQSQQQQHQQQHFTGSVHDSNYFARHTYLPYIISGYLQLVINAMVIAFIGYIFFQFAVSVSQDISMKVDEFANEIRKEISLCVKHFEDNKCDAEEGPIPHMRETCLQWQNCMTRDPLVVGRTKLSAETLAEIINSFVEPLSYKTMLFFAVFVFGFMIASNLAFTFARSKLPTPSAFGPGVHPSHPHAHAQAGAGMQPPPRADTGYYHAPTTPTQSLNMSMPHMLQSPGVGTPTHHIAPYGHLAPGSDKKYM
eukprot:GFYU01016026.1.p1 GENE.GFYU01016026.1~~GFYU01016026.1.p1  ORF type:complete len:348 (-),score=52.78 GFYU01016026.1:133-1176(-)